jgi:hypothetical protein
MNDHLHIKAINGHLTWNTPIIDLIENTCYQINFENKNIEVFISRGELVDGIEFIRATIGTFELSSINNNYFQQIIFELITPEPEVRQIIQTWFDKRITTKLNGNKLSISYDGDNLTSPSTKQLFETADFFNLNDTNNWDLGIKKIRSLLNSEYRFYAYDYHYLHFYNYGWLNLKDVEILGLRHYNFRAHFDYKNDSVTHIETIIGMDLKAYNNVKYHFESLFGKPTNSAIQETESEFKNDIWQTDKFEIKLHSAFIPRSEPEQIRYELEIKKYCA